MCLDVQDLRGHDQGIIDENNEVLCSHMLRARKERSTRQPCIDQPSITLVKRRGGVLIPPLWFKEMSKGKAGLQRKKRPRTYPIQPQQLVFKEALEYCEIRKGISKEELMHQMKTCIPEFYRNRREELEATPAPLSSVEY